MRKLVTPEWAAVIVAVVALVVSVVSCIQTRHSISISERITRLEEIRYAETHSPQFSIEYTFPECTVTDSIDARKFIRDLKVYNRGYPVREVHSIVVETLAVVSVFDKVTLNEPEKIVPLHHNFFVRLSNNMEKRYYKSYRHTFDAQGLLFEAEHGKAQESVLKDYYAYKDTFPKREVNIDIVDITTLEYTDRKGVTQRVQFLNGTVRSDCNLDKQIREGQYIMNAIRRNDKEHSRHTTMFSIFDYCYENENVLTEYRKKADR